MTEQKGNLKDVNLTFIDINMEPNRRKISLREKVDKQALRLMLDNFDDFDFGFRHIVGKQSLKTIMNKYYDDLDEEGCVNVEYYQRNGFGRYWKKNRCALQGMKGLVRNTLIKETHIDIDMENCHPVILLWYCGEHNIPCDKLRHYIENREECLQGLVKSRSVKDKNYKRGDAKKEILAVMNGGKRNVYKTTEWYAEYVNEMKSIRKDVVALNPSFYEVARLSKKEKNETEYNLDGTTLNYVLLNYENKCLMIMCDVLESYGIEVSALMFDGLMIYKDSLGCHDLKDVMNECETSILETVGINMKITRKEMTDFYDLTDYKLKKDNDIYENPPDDAVSSLFDLYEDEYINIENISKDVKYVKDLEFKSGRNSIAIKAPLGGGKTTSIMKYINTNSIKKVLVLSPRRTFAKSITTDYNAKVEGENFVNYMDCKDKRTLINYDRVVISMESLHLLTPLLMGEESPYNLLVVDEFHANLDAHVCLETNGDFHEHNLDVFRRLIRKSEKCIFADAFLGMKGLNFLSNLQIATTVYNYEVKMERRVCVEIKGEFEDFEARVFHMIKEGKKPYIFVSSKKKAMQLSLKMKATFTELNIMIYTGEEKSNDLSNVNELWSKADCVITTSTITVGINYDLEHFDNVLMSVQSRAKNRIADIFQAHYRIRKIFDKELYYHVETLYKESGGVKNKDGTVKKNFYKRRELAYDDYVLYNDWKEDEFLKKNPLYCRAPPYIRQLKNDTEYESELSMHYTREMVYNYLDACNYTQDIESTFDDTDIYDMTEVDDIEDIAYEFKDIKLLTVFEAREYLLRKKSGEMLNKMERAELDLSRFVNIFTEDGVAFCAKEEVEKIYNAWRTDRKNQMRMYNLKSEKMINTGKMTLEGMFSNSAKKMSYGYLERDRLLKLEWILEFVKDLGIKSSQDVETIIPSFRIKRIHQRIKDKHTEIHKLFSLKDRRKDKEVFEEKHAIILVNKVMKEHGFSSLNKHKAERKIVNGKKITTDVSYKMNGDSNVYNLIQTDKGHKRLLGRTKKTVL